MLDARDHLSSNLRQLLASREGSRLDQSRDIEVPDGTLGRILYKTGNPTLDSLERIARHFRVGLWQLFLPDLGAGHRKTDQSGADAAPPAVKGLIDAAAQATNVPGPILKSITNLVGELSAAHRGGDAAPAALPPGTAQGSERQKQIAAFHREAMQGGDLEAAHVFERLMQMTAPGKKSEKTDTQRRALKKG